MKIYLVGGAVRDKLLNIKSQDNDYVVVGSSIDEMLSLGYQKVGQDFPVFLHPKTKEEYALARKEVKTSKGYKGFEFKWDGVSLEEDLFRRDITINAIAMDLETSEIVDPFNGQQDIKDRKIRHVSKHFIEDPLRVLRVARFYAKLSNFEVDQQTTQLCQNLSSTNELEALTSERVWIETQKALKQDSNTRFFEYLLRVGALAKVFPELSRLKDLEQNKKYHPEGCVWTHTMLCLKHASALSSEIDVRFAALVHDLGKGTTPKDQLPSHKGHEIRSRELVKNLCKRLKVSNEIKKLALCVAENHLKIHYIQESSSEEIYQLLKSINGLKNNEFIKKVLLVCKCDDLAKERLEYPSEVFILKMMSEFKSIDFESELKGASNKQQKVKELYLEKIELIQRVTNSN